ncbi:MAG: methylenetetrahydrofolate--tRNA-(uracil(54)-C(5))-methyltransferase (FADH(2)-oxidizing) TrmFO [bacterium]
MHDRSELCSPAVTVVGAGLAGCEAALALAHRGIRVRLIEMRPAASSPAHRTGDLAELVCSNSLRSDNPINAAGALKREMAAMGSVIIAAARHARVPAGDALAVDRVLFARCVSERIAAEPRIELVREEIHEIPEPPAIIACGPLPPARFAAALGRRFGDRFLSFYDAIAPAVWAASVDSERVYAASRYGKGGGADYLNCPMTEAEYLAFVEAVRTGERVPEQSFENLRRFEGCLPIEVMADRGVETLRHGPMKPFGLRDPRTGASPYAVVQLRRDDVAGQVLNLVGFQTKLTHPEQKRVFRMIPGLTEAEFVRLGSLHRNTFLTSPEILEPTLEVRGAPGLFLAGQVTGVEGYIESAAMGILAGVNAAARCLGLDPLVPPATTLTGGLVRHLTETRAEDFQPTNVHLGLLAPLHTPLRKQARRDALARRALDDVASWIGSWPDALRAPIPVPGAEDAVPTELASVG